MSDCKSEESAVALSGPPSPYIKDQQAETRSAADLIKTEWKIIDALLLMVENTKEDGKKAFIYQTMQGHIRTLSMLLKTHGQADQSQDLAKILGEITVEAKSKARRLRQK